MGDNTLIPIADNIERGKRAKAEQITQFYTALNGKFLPRKNNAVSGGEDLGEMANPWGTAYVNALKVLGKDFSDYLVGIGTTLPPVTEAGKAFLLTTDSGSNPQGTYFSRANADNSGFEWGRIIPSATVLDGAITHAKLASDAVEADNIKDGEITHSKLGTSVVEGENIKDATITISKLAANFPSPAKYPGQIAWDHGGDNITNVNSNTTWRTITNFSVSVTPPTTSHRVKISWVVIPRWSPVPTGSELQVDLRIMRGSTQVYAYMTNGHTSEFQLRSGDGAVSEYAYKEVGFVIDSPNTTASRTYTIQMKKSHASDANVTGVRGKYLIAEVV